MSERDTADAVHGLRIAVLQIESLPLDPEANLAVLRTVSAEAREHGASLVLTPELFLTAYAPAELRGWMTPERVSGLPDRVATVARDTGIAIATSFPAVLADGGYAIAAGLYDATGAELLRYEKVHLWGEEERATFVPSAAPPAVVAWNGRRVGLQICYDIEFPEPARYLAERGADLLLVPTAIDGYSAYVPELLVRARAAENAFTVAYADYPSARDAAANDPGADFAGLSVVAGREGVPLAQAGTGAEILIVDLPEPGAGSAHAADYLRDRRPDRYADWR